MIFTELSTKILHSTLTSRELYTCCRRRRRLPPSLYLSLGYVFHVVAAYNFLCILQKSFANNAHEMGTSIYLSGFVYVCLLVCSTFSFSFLFFFLLGGR